MNTNLLCTNTTNPNAIRFFCKPSFFLVSIFRDPFEPSRRRDLHHSCPYLETSYSIYSVTQSLHSSSGNYLHNIVPRTRSSVSGSAYAESAPYLWNELYSKNPLLTNFQNKFEDFYFWFNSSYLKGQYRHDQQCMESEWRVLH